MLYWWALCWGFRTYITMNHPFSSYTSHGNQSLHSWHAVSAITQYQNATTLPKVDEIRPLNQTHAHLWFAISSARPVRSWPAFTKIGVSRRHRTWYQCVSGSVGAVDSHTVCTEPMKATSNQNARPCTVPDSKRWKSSGTSVKEPQLFKT